MADEGSNAKSSDTSAQPRRRSRARRWLWIFVIFLIVAFLAVAVFLWWRKATTPKPPPPSPPVAIATATVRKGDIGVYITALGSVTTIATVTVSTRVDGQLLRVNYTEGQMVRAGDLLVEIDPAPFLAQLTTAQGLYQRDKALLAESRINLERFKAAYSSNAIPGQQLEDQQSLVQQNEGTVKSDEGQIASAKVQLEYCRITAPISGRVGLRLVDPGNIVHAAETNGMVVITQLQPMTVVFSVAEDYLPQIQAQARQGQNMAVEAYDRMQQSKIATGRFLTLDNQIDAATGTVRVKAIFSNDDFALFPNQFVNARLLVDTQHGATLIPAAAIQLNPQGAFVYVVQPDQTVAMRSVKVGVTEGNLSAVQGVEPGEIIAADNFNRLRDRAKIVVKNPPPSPSGQRSGP